MSLTMTPDLSINETSILQTMWKLQALGNRTIALEDLAETLHISRSDASANLEKLKRRGLVSTRSHSGKDLCALSLLGAACARQIQDQQLEELGQVSRSKTRAHQNL